MKTAALVPAKYALQELAAGRFPNIWVQAIAGDFYLVDKDYNLLAGLSFKDRASAEAARTKALSVASKKHWKF